MKTISLMNRKWNYSNNEYSSLFSSLWQFFVSSFFPFNGDRHFYCYSALLTHIHTHGDTRTFMIYVQRTERYFSSMAKCYRGAIDTNEKLRIYVNASRNQSDCNDSKVWKHSSNTWKKIPLCFDTILNSPRHWISWEIVTALASEFVAIDSYWKYQRALLLVIGVFQWRTRDCRDIWSDEYTRSTSCKAE